MADIERIPAATRCELCGAEIAAQRPLSRERNAPWEESRGEWDAREAVARIAELWERSPLLASFACLRCRYPLESQTDLARKLGITKMKLHRLWKQETKENPALGRFLRGCAKMRGHEGGRKKARGGGGDE